jgi:hypothetical protein
VVSVGGAVSPDEDEEVEEEEGEEGDEGREDVEGGEGGVEVEDNEGESIWLVASTVDLALTISGAGAADAVDGAAEDADDELWSPDVLPAVADLFAFRPARSDERKASKGAGSTVAAPVDIFLGGWKIYGVEKRKAGVPAQKAGVGGGSST